MKNDERLRRTGLVPVVVIDDAADAVATAKALSGGGVDIMEITLRTEAGLDAIANVSGSVADVLVGAGTVLSLDKAKEAVKRGAGFVVSPGFDADIVNWCVDNGISVYPGCVTPTEITMALKCGIDILKFFPSNVYGGVKAMKALAGPFPQVMFIPTGGVDRGNLAEFAIPQVAAVGGGWLCPRGDIAERNFAHITEVCAESVRILAGARG
ncbi:MAG: bifunctional 4-hydroxy-2-oxoglutarate aldolase/2-dehydro-3-deoxy-phosphogluconate aldolase [Clostridiales Family XIII bacterium]|jgi:2-dehydro-3-deoxyphosphogluconate aldolase/(4S)-4-hydroxy-2-oxoglutarate aldolase|nr:bifunctional 4-hydroxy-2-oxoglutarate aldolase/2-dehydro-3-deoxy-phosphogluconate aldolase [Clostridiales Family XIII bacterium]